MNKQRDLSGLKRYLTSSTIRLLPAMVVMAAVAGLGVQYVLQTSASPENSREIVHTVQNMTAGGQFSDANSPNAAVAAKIGDILLFSIKVTNTQSSAMSNVQITNNLPVGLTVSEGNERNSWIGLNLGNIAAGSSMTRQYRAKVTPGYKNPTVENKACFSGTIQTGWFGSGTKREGCDNTYIAIGAGAATASSNTPVPKGCSALADATATAGSVGAILAVPSTATTEITVKYGTTVENLDGKSPITPAKADSETTPVSLTNLRPGQEYFYTIARKCQDSQTVNSASATFTTDKLGATVLFEDSRGAVLEGVVSSFSCAPDTSATSDANGALTFVDIIPGDCELKYTHANKQCSDKLPIARPTLSGEQAVAETVTLEYKVIACKETDAANAASSNKIADCTNASGKGILRCCSPLLLGALLMLVITCGVLTYLRLRDRNRRDGSSGGPNGGSGPGGTSATPNNQPPSNAPPSRTDSSIDTPPPLTVADSSNAMLSRARAQATANQNTQAAPAAFTLPDFTQPGKTPNQAQKQPVAPQRPQESMTEDGVLSIDHKS